MRKKRGEVGLGEESREKLSKKEGLTGSSGRVYISWKIASIAALLKLN